MNFDTFNKVVDVINLYLGILAIIIALTHMLSKNKKWLTYIVIAIYFSYSIILVSFSLEVSGKMYEYPHLLGISWPFHSFIAAAFFIYVKILVSPSSQLKKIHLLYFVPGLLYTVSLMPFLFFKSAHEKIKILQVYEQWDIISFLNLIFFNIVIIIFVVLSLNEIRLFWSRERLKKFKHFRIVFSLLVIAIVGVIFNCIGLIFESNFILRIDSIIFNIVLFTPFFLGYRYPNFMHNLATEVSNEKYKQSQLKGLNVDAVITRLTELVEIEKIYTDPELDINKLSEKLELSKHQLSEILNDKLNVNYWTYINSCRIEEAKRLLIENPEDSILKIAYSVGFNSNSVFYTAFGKITDISPSEYRKKNL